jgi:hypothetical protein
VAESDAQDALVVSSEKEIGCGERDEQIQGQHSTARLLGAGRLNDHRTNYNTGARRVPYQGAESRCCCTAVSVLCESVFLCKQMRCASAIPFEFSLRRTFGGRVRRLEDWKSGSLEGEDDSCNCRQKDHQRADDSKQSNITSVSMSCFSLSLQPTPSSVPSSQQGLLEAKNRSSAVSLRPQITL